MFALEPAQIGMMLNMMSAVSSAFTILFMFWTISILLRKFVKKEDEKLSKNGSIAILGSALVGSLAFTFTDSFWFNAVETEVYAMATLIMAILFYLGLRWEKDMHEPRGHRWLILIAFVNDKRALLLSNLKRIHRRLFYSKIFLFKIRRCQKLAPSEYEKNNLFFFF